MTTLSPRTTAAGLNVCSRRHWIGLPFIGQSKVASSGLIIGRASVGRLNVVHMRAVLEVGDGRMRAQESVAILRHADGTFHHRRARDNMHALVTPPRPAAK